MRKSPIMASLGIILVLLAACTTQEFKSESGKFSVQVPQPLAEKIQVTKTQAGTIEQHVFTAGDGKTTYLVAYADYAPESIKNDPQIVLNLALTDAITNANGQLVRTSQITLDGNPGIEFVLNSTAQDGQAMHTKAHFYLVGNRLYQVLGLVYQGSADFTVVDRFLNSFKVLK